MPAMDWPIDAHQPAQMIMGLKCCLDHTREFNPQEFFDQNPKLKEVFRVLLQGKQPPDFARAYIEALPLDHPDVLRLENAGQ